MIPHTAANNVSSNVSIGPAGWSHPAWTGLIYPAAKPRGFHALQRIARHFDTVEIQSSFYAPLKPELSQLWARLVAKNPDFRFTARLGRVFTHDRELDPQMVALFIEGLKPLHRAGKLGALLMQFPWGFRFSEENRNHFLALRRAFHEFPLAAEFRHDSWMSDEAVGTLIDYRVAFVNVDQAPAPRAMPPTAFLTTGTGYVRFEGRGPGYLYPEAELREWKTRIDSIARHAKHVHVVFANEFEGRSLVNAFEMQSLYGEPVRVPRELALRYPVELAHLRPSKPLQTQLFTAELAVA